jgi:hypothetical protein
MMRIPAKHLHRGLNKAQWALKQSVKLPYALGTRETASKAQHRFPLHMAGRLLKLGDSHPFTCKFEQFPIIIFLNHLYFLTSHPSLHQGPFHLAIPFPPRFGNLLGIRVIIIGFHLAIRIDSAGPTIASRFWRSAWRLWVRGIHALFVFIVLNTNTKSKLFARNLRKIPARGPAD